jgi:hypothetical protein
MFRRPAPTLARMPAQRDPKQTLQSVNTLNAHNQAGMGNRPGLAASQNSATQRPAQMPFPGATSQSVPGMGLAGMPKGGTTFKKGGKVKASSASKRADGCAVRGKTKGKMV